MMYKRGAGLLVIVLAIMITAACKAEDKQQGMEEMIDVKAKISQNPGAKNEPVTFEALITQGDDKVTDADSVEFEFYHEDGTEKEKVAVEHHKNGIYKMEKSFQKEGVYYFIPHVTARGMHAMPKEEFEIK